VDWWAPAESYWLARWCVQRGLGATYLVAFVVVLRQFRPLLGERGLLPVPEYLRRRSFWEAPSLFHWRYSDRLLAATAWAGVALAAAAVVGLTEAGPLWLSMACWAVLWALYQSVVNVGQTFYAFGWESLLLEAGFLAIFLGSSDVVPPLALIVLLRWLLFRVEFGAGLIKLRGDPCWRDLTCLRYHHETQPLPNRWSRAFHHLPDPLHRVEVAANHVAQLVVPFGLLGPQPIATVAGVVIIATQGWLVLSGNFAWLNVLTIVLALAAFDDAVLDAVVPVDPPTLDPSPAWHDATVALVVLLVVILSWWPVRNLLSPRQAMNRSFNPLHLVNTYGAFGSITRVRNEVVVEGTLDAEPTARSEWRPYEFKAKPGDPRRRPRQVAPYHLRLDWLMWFLALDRRYGEPWFVPFVVKLLEGDRATLKLLRHDPFPDGPPQCVRARLYRYRFSTRAERRATGDWWVRAPVGELLPPASLASGGEDDRRRLQVRR